MFHYLQNPNRFLRFHIPDESLPLPLAFAIPSGDNDDSNYNYNYNNNNNNNNNHGEQFQIGKNTQIKMWLINNVKFEQAH